MGIISKIKLWTHRNSVLLYMAATVAVIVFILILMWFVLPANLYGAT